MIGQRDDDFALMERIAAKDRAALDALYSRYSPMVFALALRILGDRGFAEDLLIDVFFELWNRAERYDATRGAPITYITTLTRSRAIDRKRTRSGRPQSGGEAVQTTLASTPATGHQSDPVGHAVLQEQAAAVRAAMASLDHEHRQALELSYFEGLSHSEIAGKLGKPLGTVKTHIRSAIIRMKQLVRIDPGGG